MADTARDAFPDEAETAFTLDEYIEGMEAVELVTSCPSSSDS
jgi:E3 ubiquitin-protein ligase UBR7